MNSILYYTRNKFLKYSVVVAEDSDEEEEDEDTAEIANASITKPVVKRAKKRRKTMLMTPLPPKIKRKECKNERKTPTTEIKREEEDRQSVNDLLKVIGFELTLQDSTVYHDHGGNSVYPTTHTYNQPEELFSILKDDEFLRCIHKL